MPVSRSVEQETVGSKTGTSIMTKRIFGISVRPTGGTAVTAGCDISQAVHQFQFTRCWISAIRSRRFGMDAELCGCALLAATLMFHLSCAGRSHTADATTEPATNPRNTTAFTVPRTSSGCMFSARNNGKQNNPAMIGPAQNEAIAKVP